MAFAYSLWNAEWQRVQRAKFGNPRSPVRAALLLLRLFGEVVSVRLREAPRYCTARPARGEHGAAQDLRPRAAFVSSNVAGTL